MPLYDFKCAKCGRVEESFAKVDEYEQACTCGWTMQRQVSAPIVRPPMQPYQSPVTGKWIEGDRMRKDDLARHDCIPYDPEMRKDAVRKREENDQKLDLAAEKAVEAAWSQIQH
jgi:putative FmdB family regulatory protein